jgi:hypothetical protein
MRRKSSKSVFPLFHKPSSSCFFDKISGTIVAKGTPKLAKNTLQASSNPGKTTNSKGSFELGSLLGLGAFLELGSWNLAFGCGYAALCSSVLICGFISFMNNLG